MHQIFIFISFIFYIMQLGFWVYIRGNTMNLGLGMLWSIPTIILLLVSFLLLRKPAKAAKFSGYASLLLGSCLLVGVCLLFLDVFEVAEIPA